MHPQPLTRRQLEILLMRARGMTERQIAADLIISYETVHQHGKVARERLDARSVSHALAICVERGYVVVIDGSLAPAPAVELVAA